MKIVYIIPGSGDSFYCGNCFRDNLQAAALRKAGHDVVVMPLYLPLINESLQNSSPLFFPATSYYVAQKFFQKFPMPKWLKGVLGSETMLRLASHMSGTTSAKGMENMTMSMIEGDENAFMSEADKLISLLKQESPDIIQISTTLLIGIARAIKNEMDIPIVCSVLDEEVWIDTMKEEYAALAWKAIGANLKHVDKFITVSHYYKNFVKTKVPLLTDLDVIYPGLDLEAYRPGEKSDHPVIGYFYRLNELNGLEILAKAFVQLKKKNSVPELKLKVGGGFTGQDKKYIAKVKKILAPYIEDVDLFESYSLSAHIGFFQNITVLSVPLTFNEGFSLYVSEAFACGVPVVEPETGAFPEIVGEAGILYQPNTSASLANALEEILTKQDVYDKAAKAALKKSSEIFNDTIMVNELLKTYHNVRN